MLNVFDEFSRECLAIRVARKLKVQDAIDVLSDLFSLRGVPGHIRSDKRAGVHCQGRTGLDRGGWTDDCLHRAGQSLGERLLCELQREAAGRTPQRRGVLHPQGGQRRNRAMAAALQQHPTALVARLSPACAGGRHLANGTEQLSAARSTRHRHATCP